MNQWKQRILSGVLALGMAGTLLAGSLPTAFAGQQLGQTNFDDGVGLPWHVCESLTGKMDFNIDNGTYNITIVNPGGGANGGEDRWDCQFRHRGLHLVSGATYQVSYTITASNSCTYYTKIGDMGEPYTEDWHGEPDGGQFESFWDVKQLSANQATTVTGSFTAKRDAEVEWAFHIGGDSVPAGTKFTFDNMSLTSSDSKYDYVAAEPWVRSDILTNQLGYFEKMTKRATLLSDASKGVEFDLNDESGKSVFSGTSTVIGSDADSGDAVHMLDFSEYTTPGTYTLSTKDGATSRAFKIGNGELYSYILYDSLNYFYQNRSGIEIESKYIISGDGSKLARAAGHASDMATIDHCWGYSGSSGTQDVSGGWYDAGDHGKYVVNGGISLWTMQNQYELAVKKGDASVFGDNTMSIPESGNGYPDLLDEARYEMEWFLKMIVKDGDYAGMAYHKIHDTKWTALAVAPADDTEERIVKPPTTPATLNVAACGAQAYRLWKELDATFADQCLTAAKSAYEAAKKHPEMFAPLDESIGGGAYGDDDAKDEFYWAACELYAATGDAAYLSDMKASDFYLTVGTTIDGGEHVNTNASMDWGNTATLGSLTMSLYSDTLDDASTLAGNLTKAGDFYKELSDKQGYGQPYGQSTVAYNDSDSGYIWGSNSAVLNNGIVLTYAFINSGDSKYLSGAVSAMDYILGRNPNDYSYVTGYGTHAVAYPHHRWWSGQINPDFPFAPNGVVVGGPNSGMQDPWVKGAGWKKGTIAPAKCYLDHIEAWSVNECTINWNTPLAWLSAFLANEAGGITVTHGSSDNGSNSGQSASENDAAGSADKNGTSSGKATDSKKDNAQAASASKNTQDKADGKSNTTTWIIVAAILVALISIEVFVYKFVKMSKTGAAAAPTIPPQNSQNVDNPVKEQQNIDQK